MREEEFKAWLEDRGATSKSGLTTRVYAIRTIEKKLGELGFDYLDLDDAWKVDEFQLIKDKISLLRSDFIDGGKDFQILMPESANPLKRLSNFKSWLGQYGQFLSTDPNRYVSADRIRHYVLENYIEPARQRGEDSIEIIVKPINDALDLNANWANVCQAMTGPKFQSLADVHPPQRYGAKKSSATRYIFKVDKADYWALNIIIEKLGQPFDRTKKIAKFELPDGRQLALDLQASQAQIWVEGQDTHFASLDLELNSYVPDAPRHSNLPSRLKHSSNDSRLVSSLKIPNGEVLNDVINIYLANDNLQINKTNLNRLKLRFLHKFPDFEKKRAFEGQSAFHREEDDYKRALIEQASILMQQKQSDEELGRAMIALLAGTTLLPSNLIDWRAQKTLDKACENNPGIIEAAAGKMLYAEDAIEAILQFVDKIWDLLSAELPSMPYAESRMIPSMLRALVDQDSIIAIRSNPTQNFYQILLDQQLFKFAPLSRSELENTNKLAKKIFAIMRDDWDWKPRDLWDVQSFIWVTCQDKLKENEMTNEELLNRFDVCEKFKQRRSEWSDEQSDAFCKMARAVHDIGLDWYHTNIPEIRFGKRELEAKKATPTFGTLILNKDAILAFSHSFDNIGSLSKHAFDQEGADAFIDVLNKNKDEILKRLSGENKREGYWPDKYGEAAIEDDESEEKPMKKAINLILYGPPGTGKTYETMKRAVELCSKIPESDRKELREQYEGLIKAKQIEFVTFHQNFAYEEFVEGMRPHTAEGGSGFSLKPESGIFRNLCTLADAARNSVPSAESLSHEHKQIFKMSLGRAGIEDEIFEDAKDNDYITLGWGGDIDWQGYKSYEAIYERWNQDFPNTHGSDSNIAQVSRFVVDMQIGDLVIISYGNKKVRAIAEIEGDYEYNPTGVPDYNHRRRVRWLKHFDDPIDASIVSHVNFSQKSCYLINKNNLNREGLSTLLPSQEDDNKSPKQFVLIIDEINRANVSKVFGELITLIEPDKRLGADNQLKVQLPYSKKNFGVPSNLHIIGTMNTADRSIAQLDSALRRRFTFEELAPDTDVQAFKDAENATGIELGKVLNRINERIEYFIDRDHRIGHAFFIGCEDKKDVDAVMRDKIIPLLQEYFFYDWKRMAAVLGEYDKGGNFLDVTKINDPMGEDKARESWSVKRDFEDVDYDHISGSSKNSDQETNSDVSVK